MRRPNNRSDHKTEAKDWGRVIQAFIIKVKFAAKTVKYWSLRENLIAFV